MKEFELWLDESGDFKSDAQNVRKGKNPSLIGGVLIEKEKLRNKRVDEEKIIGTKVFHCKDMNHTQEGAEGQFLRFKKIVESDLQLVIFNNEECIMIIDNNITYQNIMVQGIIQLIEYLKAKYGDVKLEILLDKRRDTTKKEKIYIDNHVYINRIEEKIVLENHSIKRSDFTIKDGCGIQNKKLMVADIVCNTILTRDSIKFRENGNSEYINNIYENEEKTIKFTVLQPALKAAFYDLMSTGRLGEAVAVLCQSKEKRIIEHCIKVVDDRLSEMQEYDIEFHYRFIELYIKYSLEISRDYSKCRLLLENLVKLFLPMLSKHVGHEISDRIEMDIRFYMLTLYTHMGDIKSAEKCIMNCDRLMLDFIGNWEIIVYRFRYNNRKIMNQVNMFDFENALSEAKTLVERCEAMKQAIEVWADNGEEDIKFSELAKALGSQVQIYTFLMRKKPELYNDAIKISDAAIAEFVSDEDIRRQYIYRSQLETQKEEYENALKYLLKVNNLQENAGIKELTDAMQRKSKKDIIYSFSAYVNLMAEGVLSEWTKSEEMYQAIFKNDHLRSLIQEQSEQHPYEIILWKCGSYEVHSGRISAGRKKMERAIGICFKQENLTLFFIGLAILFEYYAIILQYALKEKRGILKNIRKQYQRIYEMELPESMNRIYEDVQLDNDKWEYFYELSRRITY